MKKCPACAEDIQEEALKCRWCGEDFRRRPAAPISEITGQAIQRASRVADRYAEQYRKWFNTLKSAARERSGIPSDQAVPVSDLVRELLERRNSLRQREGIWRSAQLGLGGSESSSMSAVRAIPLKKRAAIILGVLALFGLFRYFSYVGEQREDIEWEARQRGGAHGAVLANDIGILVESEAEDECRSAASNYVEELAGVQTWGADVYGMYYWKCMDWWEGQKYVPPPIPDLNGDGDAGW